MNKIKDKTFSEYVLDIVSRIPKGQVLSYKQVAEKSGNIKASRAVGSILKNNKDKSVPCHRVILSSGKVGNYNGLLNKSKGEILKKEGVNL